MVLQAPKRENMIALVLFMIVMALKLSAIIALCTKHSEHGHMHDDLHAHHSLKKQHKPVHQTSGQKYVT